MKIERSAPRQGLAPIELAARVVTDHRQLWKKLNISHDDFIRTTEGRHRVGVYEIIRHIQERNPEDIYSSEFEGWYRASEESFFPDSQVSHEKCENGHPVELGVMASPG